MPSGLWKEGVLSDGQPVRVRMLTLFELEDRGVHIPPDFTYIVTGGDGKEYEQPYDLRAVMEHPPAIPGPDADEWDRIEWARFQAAILRRQEQEQARQADELAKARYILEHCLVPEDRERVITDSDYDTVYNLALCPEVRLEDVESELARFFRSGVEWYTLNERLAKLQGQRRELPGHAQVGAASDAGMAAIG